MYIYKYECMWCNTKHCYFDITSQLDYIHWRKVMPAKSPSNRFLRLKLHEFSDAKVLCDFPKAPAVMSSHGIWPREVHPRKQPWDLLRFQEAFGQLHQPDARLSVSKSDIVWCRMNLSAHEYGSICVESRNCGIHPQAKVLWKSLKRVVLADPPDPCHNSSAPSKSKK